MRFQAPQLLWLGLPWLVGWFFFARTQAQALDWAMTHVSDRFRSRLTVHSKVSLRWHLGLLAVMGLLLICAAARPYLPGATEIEAEHARVVLVMDGSASMYATDVEPSLAGELPEAAKANRFAAARATATALVESMPNTSFAVVSFSGHSALHTPMTSERGYVLEALHRLEVHGQYRNSGSSLRGALDALLDFQDDTRPNLQAVFLTDGEQPVEETLDGALEALTALSVPVHTVAIGSTEGQNRLIYDFRDIVAKKEEPAVLREYHTRRIDERLQQIADATGGHFEVLSTKTPDALISAISEHQAPPARIERSGAGEDLGGWFLLAFLIGFLTDGLLIGRRPVHAPYTLDLDRLGPPRPRTSRAAGLLLLAMTLPLLASCANTPRARAYRENEQGIALDALGRHTDARVHYKRSIGYDVRPEVPTFNLARSVHREGDYSAAHDLYQEALQIDPRLPEAYYNDGIALFEWGEAERDPLGCELERTQELWTRALQRFARTVGLTKPGRKTGRQARENHAYLGEELAEIERLIEDPPPECQGGGEGGQGNDQEQEGGGGGGGQGDDQQQGGGGGGQGDDQQQGGGGGDDDDQQQGGGAPDPQPGDQPPPPPGEDLEWPAGGSPPPLTQEELDQIGRELERIARQGREPGKYHRRTLPEQFGKEHWGNPERIIWW